MNRIISISLLFFWAIQFALQTVAAVKGLPLAFLSPFDNDVFRPLGSVPQAIPAWLLASMSGLIAAAFVWATITEMAGSNETGEGNGQVTRLAFASAIAVVTLLTVVAVLNGEALGFSSVAMVIVALAVSWLATLRESELGSHALTEDNSQAVASRMAGEAAHKTMLGVLTGRSGKTGGAH